MFQKKKPAEPDADDKKKKAAKKPAGKPAAWQDVANQMLGNVPATGVGSPKAGNGCR